MKQQGLMDLYIVKDRTSNGTGRVLNMIWNPISMTITEPSGDDFDKIKNHTRKSDDINNAKNNGKNRLLNMVDKT